VSSEVHAPLDAITFGVPDKTKLPFVQTLWPAAMRWSAPSLRMTSVAAPFSDGSSAIDSMDCLFESNVALSRYRRRHR
jgi:hypothetical protein